MKFKDCRNGQAYAKGLTSNFIGGPMTESVLEAYFSC